MTVPLVVDTGDASIDVGDNGDNGVDDTSVDDRSLSSPSSSPSLSLSLLLLVLLVVSSSSSMILSSPSGSKSGSSCEPCNNGCVDLFVAAVISLRLFDDDDDVLVAVVARMVPVIGRGGRAGGRPLAASLAAAIAAMAMGRNAARARVRRSLACAMADNNTSPL